MLAAGDGLEVIATAPDGVVEALWHPGMRFGLGVQWHPEMLAASFPEHAALFEALVRSTAVAPPACAERDVYLSRSAPPSYRRTGR
ncbi:MAG: Para-aminobenzoate synthase, amidotransferase component [uncultured Thermomicrobiales bacterium]|uniref:Para-aminobenzoate synthase, amidotransferase component n=1 Tax=uncultured Thermomicrobiales bacterium TaxID=1645740 RepID=A0A6J4VD81_9BACT|nr:MAG: Para-aminobenzoate synthase, amidotransferase component [uncultured Thermomicrobiales bacterium]